MKVKIKRGLKEQLLLLFIIFMLIIGLVIGVFTYQINDKQVCQQYLELGTSCANMAISCIDFDRFEEFSLICEDEEYENLKYLVNKIVKHYNLESIYIFNVEEQTPKINYILNCEANRTDSELRNISSDIIEDEQEYNYYLTLYKGKRTEPVFETTVTKYGYLASIYIPVVSVNSGKIVAVIGVDISMQNILNEIKVQTVTTGLLTTFCVIVFGIILLVIINRRVINPIKMISDKMGSFVKQGQDLNSEPIVLNRRDELKLMADSFNKMVESLNVYIKDLTKITSEKEKINSELNVAKKIQASLLPCIFPAYPERNDIEIFASMDPARAVGGDLYDFFFIDENNLAVLIADVSGKGVAAALFMVIAKTLLKNEIQSGIPINEALMNVNRKLCENNDEGMFVTAFAAVLNVKTGELKYSNAGHNRPLVYSKKNNKFDWLKMNRGFVLAGIDSVKYKLESMSLDKGDVLFLYTDGVTEAMNKENKLFSDQRLFDLMNDPKVKTLSAEEIVKYVKESITAFANGADQSDDITMLILRKTI